MSLDNKGVWAVIVIIALVGGLAGGWFMGSAGVGPVEGGLQGTQTIVFLAPLTGALSTYGENSQEAAELAEAEVNAWLTARGESWSLDLVVDDTATDPTQADTRMRAWHGQGVEIFVGPMSSGECSQLKSYGDSNELLFVSPSSTAAMAGLHAMRAQDCAYRSLTRSRDIWTTTSSGRSMPRRSSPARCTITTSVSGKSRRSTARADTRTLK